MPVSLAIVHHTSQILMTDGYPHRESVNDALMGRNGIGGIAHILSLHHRYGIAVNMHINGALLEIIAWHKPELLQQLRALYCDGLVEFIGSCYSQNMMCFFDYEHMLHQLNKELYLYHIYLGVDPKAIKNFWPPERVWDTNRLAPILTDRQLLNNGYDTVLVDDHALAPNQGSHVSRRHYNYEHYWDINVFQAYNITDGQGLVALPISTTLRYNIPPHDDAQWDMTRLHLDWLSMSSNKSNPTTIAIYADSIKEIIGFERSDETEVNRYEIFLNWLHNQCWITPVKLINWLDSNRISKARTIQTHTACAVAQWSVLP